MTAKHRLRNVSVEEISFVNEGDNPEAHIIFTKAKPKPITGEQMTPEQYQAQLDSKDAMIEEMKNKISELEAKVSESEKEEQSEPASESESEIMKSLPESLRKKLDEDMAEIAKARADIAKVKDEQLTKEFITKAKDANLTEDIGKMFKSLHTKDEILAKNLFDEMARLQKALFESDLLKEKGQSGETETETAHEQLVKMAKEAQKVDATMSFEKAYTLVKKNNPELSKKASKGE